VVSDFTGFKIAVATGLPAEEMTSLRAWLSTSVDSVRVTTLQQAPSDGELGLGTDTLLVAIAPGGVALGVLGAVVAWLRSRRSDVELKITAADGRTIEVAAKTVRGLDVQAASRFVSDIAATLDRVPSDPPLVAGVDVD
jgi:16S rRNA G1207 methylase RsmC